MATNYTIDKSHTHVTFSISHFMIAKVKGSFKEFSGTVVALDDDMEAPSLRFPLKPVRWTRMT
jgi:polyisoprenoid-binding protein YceI